MSSHTNSHGLRWPIILLAIIGFIAISPILLGLLFTGIALTAGLAVLAVKIGVVALIVWAMVMLFKGLFGSKNGAGSTRATPPSDALSGELSHFDMEAELERHRSEHLASLDRELASALARKNAEAR